MTAQSTFVANGVITQDNTSGYQVLETTDVTLTASQFQGFSSIISGTGTGGVIYGATGGTYDLEGKSTEDYNLVAQSDAGTTLIGDNANGEHLTASATGADTLQAGNGAGDVLFAGGGSDKLIGGSGGDTFYISTGAATVTGGSGGDTFVINEGGSGPLSSSDSLKGGAGQNTLFIDDYSDDISGVSFSSIQTLELIADVSLTASQFAAFSTIEIDPGYAGSPGRITATTGGTCDLEGKSTYAFDLFAGSDAGTTLIGNDADGETLGASATGADTLQAGNGTGDILSAGGGADKLIGGNGGDTFYISTGVETVIGGSGGDTFYVSTDGLGLSAGDAFQGGSGQNTLFLDDYSENISGVALSGIQTLEFIADISLTAAQFGAFSTIEVDPGYYISVSPGQITATTGGTFDLEGKSTQALEIVAGSNAGTSLIGGDVGGDVLKASATGADTLQAGNGAGDVLYAGGGADTLIAGSGTGAELYGGAGADRFVLSNSGSATVNGGTGSNTAVFSGDEANYSCAVSFANGVFTTTVTNKANGAVDTLIDVQSIDFADVSTTPIALMGGIAGLLTNPTVKAAVASVLVNNSISDQGMLTVLQDVAAQGPLTSSEFSSLQTLVSFLNVPGGIAVSSYVRDITAALVDGNPANSSSLAAGSSAAQLNGLIGEWFLGTDLPSLAGFSNIAYQTDASALYGAGGAPLYTDANQGELGDCYLIASIGECALMDPSEIESMFTNNGDGTYGVRFFVDGTADYVTVNTELPYFTNNLQWANGSTLAFANGPPMWAELIEKAFVELNAEPGATGETTGNAYEDIASGDAEPISLITGKSVSGYYYANYSSEASWSSAVLSVAASAFAAGQEVLVGTGDTVADTTRFVADHMFEVIGYNASTQLFTLYNPWGSAASSSTPTNPTPMIIFTASMADLYNNDCEIYVASGQTLAPTDVGVPRDFNGDGQSDILLENTSGAVVVGEDVGGSLAYKQVTALGPEWSFVGNGDFLGDGGQDFLIANISGAVVVGEVSNGVTNYTQVTALGPEWSFMETGDFLGNGQDQFLIENKSGVVALGNVVGGQAQYTQVATLGPEWSFVGEGDLLGDGNTGFLIENTSGAVVVGEVANGATDYTQIATLGPQWTFKGVGDFLGNGHDQFLIENSNGAVDIGNYSNGQEQNTEIAVLGPEWSFIGTGDYLGTGTDGFMIENTSGAIVLGAIASGQARFTQVGALGSEWKSHS